MQNKLSAEAFPNFPKLQILENVVSLRSWAVGDIARSFDHRVGGVSSVSQSTCPCGLEIQSRLVFGRRLPVG